jgi:hypothetical protein
LPKKPSAPLTKRRGHEIKHLPGLERLDAIAREMWGPPEPRERIVFGHKVTVLNHNSRLAKLVGISDRRMRQIRETGHVPEQLLKSFTTAWKLWRRRQHDIKMRDRLVAKRAAAKARVKALQERGIEAVRG